MSLVSFHRKEEGGRMKDERERERGKTRDLTLASSQNTAADFGSLCVEGDGEGPSKQALGLSGVVHDGLVVLLGVTLVSTGHRARCERRWRPHHKV